MSFPPGTEMFQFPGFAFLTYKSIGVCKGGFPHSEISGSKVVRTSPELIAAYHVFRRLCAPRHPLETLVTLDSSDS
ncbi:unnamed protein product [Hapterophycus canaliculatus]